MPRTGCGVLTRYESLKKMPVEEHEVHEKVRQKDDAKYGCHNRQPYAQGYWAKDGFRMEEHEGQMYGVQQWVWVDHTMSSECRSFYLWRSDAMCKGCKVAKDYEYEQRMRGLE